MKQTVDKRKLFTIWSVICGVLVLLTLLCIGAMLWIMGQLQSLDAADRWRGDNEMRFAQIACFLPVDEGKKEEDIWQFRRTLDQKLTEASVASPTGGKLYRDAWSASGKVQASTAHGSAEAAAIGVGGDFFLFHPLQLRSGGYLHEEDLMQDRVILDETLAWTLFGGVDVAGMEVQIAGRPFTVAGVIHREDDFASKEAYRDGPGLFLSYTALNAIQEKPISTYEIVLPDMITGFGLHLVQENFPVGSTGAVVENSSRYSLKNLFQVAGDYGLRSMGLSGVIYPYWENAVRMTEDYLALLLVLSLVFGLAPVLTLVVLAILAIVRSWRYVRQKVPAGADSLVEKHREAKYAERMKNKEHADVQ